MQLVRLTLFAILGSGLWYLLVMILGISEVAEALLLLLLAGSIVFFRWAGKKYPTFPFLVSLWKKKLKGYIIIAGIGIFLWLLISISWQLTAKQ